MFSNPKHLHHFIKRSLKLAHLHDHRVLLLLAGVDEQRFVAICDEVKQLINNHKTPEADSANGFETQLPVNIMHLPNSHSNSDNSDHINALLGTEYKCLIFDAYDAFNERLFAASAGTVAGGGILVLRTPSLNQWADNPHGQQPSKFIRRFIKKIELHQSDELNNEESKRVEGQSRSTQTKAILIADTVESDAPTTETNWPVEQTQLIKQLHDSLLNKKNTTAVVQADRGRGKSTLIGLTIRQMRADKRGAAKTVTLTANRLSACKVLLRHAIGWGEKDCPIKFVPIDQALTMKHDVLIVEEAGSISIPVLNKLTTLSNNIVFATTVQGYEGAGRGFALRFSKQLDQHRPDWIMLNPQLPIRWSNNDPVEAFINDALLLKTVLPSIEESTIRSASNAQLIRIDKRTLSSNDQLLEEIYSLLIQAHYQTTPADLRNMLDEEQLLVFAQYDNKTLTGAALVAIEGEIPNELHTDIVQKKRRLPDQILPQLLAQSAADTTALIHSYARIVRIAIHPELHRQGFGTQLINDLQTQLYKLSSSIGASFGADTQAISFWLKLGFTPIHYGYKANPRSGLRSACLLKAKEPSVVSTINKAATILHKNLDVLDLYANETDEVRARLITATEQNKISLSESEKLVLLSAFSQSSRSFIDTVGFIHPLSIAGTVSDNSNSTRKDTAGQIEELGQYLHTLLRTQEESQVLGNTGLRKGLKQKRRIAEKALRDIILDAYYANDLT